MRPRIIDAAAALRPRHYAARVARTYFVITRERGPQWDQARPMREQDGWDEHAAFMDALAEEGFVVLGGPLGNGDRRFMHVVEAASAEAVRERLASDPWEAAQLATVGIEPWQILLTSP
jgi:uncharacterized protein